MYKEQVQLGYSKMLPQIALGHSQSSIINTAYFENEILRLLKSKDCSEDNLLKTIENSCDIEDINEEMNTLSNQVLTYLYNKGDMCWNIIGTWLIENQSNAAVMMYENADYLRFINQEYETWNCYGWATSQNSVNINNYNYLRIHVKQAYWGYSYGTNYSDQQD